ncbi:MAG: DNA polymerase domain-containing protein [Candidatus Thorarchaeota archaeon]
MKNGWLLDAGIDWERQALTLWIKSQGKTRGYLYRGFHPSLFVSTDLFKEGRRRMGEILHSVMEHPSVVDAEITRRFVSVYDDEMTPVLRVSTTPDALRRVADDLARIPGATVYHADIDPIQQFFIMHDVFPFGRIEYESIEGEVTHLRGLDNREDVEYETPDLEEMSFEVFVDTERIFPDIEDPIHHIEVYNRGQTIRIEGDDERDILLRFQETVDSIDPDIIVSVGGDDTLFRYLSLRARVNGVQLIFSRDGTPLNVKDKRPQSFWQYNQVVFRAGNQVMFNGRIHIDRAESMYYSPVGMEGIIEGCRLAFAPPQRVARMSIGTVNAAVQYYNAFRMGILIPPVKKNPEFLKSLVDLMAIDRGGLILQPKPDVYENIAECDFSSMYPTLMVTRNISPETICMREDCPYDHQYCIEVPELNFRLCTHRQGLVAKSLELVIKKRNAFKRLIQEGHDAHKYELMQNTLKGVLVSCFGYLGFKNARFGRVEAHTAVTALARETLLRTQEIAEEMGLEMVHGIVDSLWLRSEEKMQYDRVVEFCERVTEEVNIPMSPKGIYRWMVIPSSRMHSSIAPLNRYYGVYVNGAIKTRGIETRRRDTCLYIGDCQMAMIKTLARAPDKAGFLERIPEARAVCQRYMDRLYEGDVDLRDLILHSRLTRNPEEYRTTSRAAVVARQLVRAGKELHAGQKVRYVLTNTSSRNPMQRVMAAELVDTTTKYDAEAYAMLCERAFENLVPAQYLESSGSSEPEQTLLPTTF